MPDSVSLEEVEEEEEEEEFIRQVLQQ